MNRSTVKSTHVKSIGHDGRTMEVEYRNGDVYRYPNVTASDYNKILANPSTGRALHRHVLLKNKGTKL